VIGFLDSYKTHLFHSRAFWFMARTLSGSHLHLSLPGRFFPSPCKGEDRGEGPFAARIVLRAIHDSASVLWFMARTLRGWLRWLAGLRVGLGRCPLASRC